jgi:alpha-amylase
MNSSIAVTFVENHDTQPGQAFGSSAIPDNFKTLAYALTLLRKDGYPCVFYADYYGAEYEDKGVMYKVLDCHWL